MAGGDPEDIHGWSVLELVPRPVPFRFRLLDPVERGWRGRAAIRLWLMGYPPRTAWLHAMSEDTEQSHDLSNEVVASNAEYGLPGAVLRRRLHDVVQNGDQSGDAQTVSLPIRPE